MKAKKLIISILAASPLMLTACPGNDKNVSAPNGNGDVVYPSPGGQPGTPIKRPNAFFNALRQSENLLYQNYLFSSRIIGHDIEYSDLDKINGRGLTTFQELARAKNQSVKTVKLSFYDDIYAFAQNYEILKIRETELKSYNPTLYQEYEDKTLALGKIFIVKRARIYSRLLEYREEQLYKVGIQEIRIINMGILDLSIVGVDYQQISRKRRNRLVNAIKNARKVCDGLTTMLNDRNYTHILDRIDIRECASSPAVLRASKLLDVDSLSKDEIARTINSSSINYVKNLDVVADSYLSANSIVLAPGNISGIRNRIRRSWENEIRRQNSRVRRDVLDAAINNNLYENLIFKRNVLNTLVTVQPYMTPEKRENINGALRALSKGLKNLRHQNVNFNIGSSAITNGVGSEDLSVARNNDQPKLFNNDTGFELDNDFEGDDLSEFDDIGKAPTKSPTPVKSSVDQGDGPPPPPTSVRRRP